MGVYSRPIMEEKIISFEEFVEYFQESDYQMRMMFEKEELVYSIQEANDSELQLPSIVRNVEFTAGEPEKVKKTLIEWIKETFSKFIQAIKDLFDKVSKAIYDFYMRTNFIDDIVSKFKDKVTYQNLEKARDKGWKGLSVEKGELLINREADTYLSDLSISSDRDYIVKVEEEDFTSIIRAKDLNDAKEQYNKFKEKLTKFKSRIMFDTPIDLTIRMSSSMNSSLDDYIGFYGKVLDQEKKYYFPATKQFALTKQFAESGQKRIKEIKEHNKNLAKGLNEQKSFFLNNMNLFKNKDSSNNTGDKETDQINILYYKAQYEYSSAYIMRVKRVINSLTSVLKNQHRIAIRTYTVMAMAVNKYVTA